MIKYKLALSFAVAAAFFTACFGLINDIRAVTLLYRMFVSIAVFGFFGYLLSLCFENYLNKLSLHSNTKGRNIDITATEDDVPTEPQSSFSPLTPDKFEHITSEK